MIQGLLIALAVLAMMIPLAWVCLQMAQHAEGGTALLAGIAAAVVIGALATIAGLLRR
ncbi:MAG TPA: hypothetical protein VMA77_01675 [Solirubrobacteraceae bacterium]|nr:hypothetical protein [Solirubrobacteraceae bacterium]